LYITAMKYAGCSLENNKDISSIDNIVFSDENRAKLLNFFNGKFKETELQQGETVVEFKDVSFEYDQDKPVLENTSFAIHKGERIAVVGRNGAGKSTAAKLITGIIRPQKGSVEINGKDYRKLSVKEIGEMVGYVMQNPN